MAKIRSRQIVIDASIARAAGPEGAIHPTARLCREFLLAVQEVCHHMIFTTAIQDEWNKHQSGFARKRRVSMFAKRKIDRIEVAEDAPLRNQIERHAKEPAIVEIVLKDCHLIEAACASDFRVTAIDDKVRLHLITLAPAIAKIQPVFWANPTVEAESVIEWLEAGAPDEKTRCLGFAPPSE